VERIIGGIEGGRHMVEGWKIILHDGSWGLHGGMDGLMIA
jgi:hypothetical protein